MEKNQFIQGKLKNLRSTGDTKKIIDKYGVSKVELKKRKGVNDKTEEVKF